MRNKKAAYVVTIQPVNNEYEVEIIDIDRLVEGKFAEVTENITSGNMIGAREALNRLIYNISCKKGPMKTEWNMVSDNEAYGTVYLTA